MTRLLAILTIAFAIGCMEVFGVTDDPRVNELSAKFNITREESNRALTWAGKFRDEIEKDGLYAAAVRGDEGLNALVEGTLIELKKKGATEYADQKRAEWEQMYKGELTRLMQSRHIGDHPTAFISQWLEDFVDQVIFVIGLPAAKALHITDLKTINACTIPTFRPCSFPMNEVTVTRKEEYRNHFALDNGGEELYGETPVILYWVVEGSLMASGVGILASPISMAAEYAFGHWMAGKLSDAIFDRVCSQ